MFQRSTIAAICLAGLAVFSGFACAGENAGKPKAAAPQRKESTRPVPTGSQVTLTLADAVFLGLRNNPSIRSAYIDRVWQKFDLRVAEDIFTPHFTLNGNAQRQRIAGVNSTSADFSPTATILAPTGATIGLTWDENSTDTAGVRTRTSAGTVSLAQPLLRGGGIEVTRAPMDIARFTERTYRLQLKATVSQTVTQIILAHRGLLQAQEARKLADGAVARAQDLLDVNRALIDAGRMAQSDILQVEADLENQKIQVLQAQSQVETARLGLLVLLNLDLGTNLLATEKLDPKQIPTSLPHLLQVAFAQRPDYQSQLMTVEASKLGLTVAKNQELWDLSVFSNGTFGHQKVSGGGQPADYTGINDVTVGVKFSAPLNDLTREQTTLHATTTLQSAQLQLDVIRLGVEQQIRSAINDVELSWRQVEMARRARELAAKAVEKEREKLKAGRSTNIQVRSLENDLRNADTQQLGVIVGYLNAVSTLDLQLGTALDTWKITLKN
jgi:outer membrane protein TolC